MGSRIGKIHVADIALGIIAAALVVYVALPLLDDNRAPVVYGEAVYEGPREAGASGVVWYRGERVRSCDARVLDFWILPSGKRVTVFDDAGNWTDVGEFNAPVAVTIPDAGPGLYIYRSRITHHCSDGIHNETNPPDVLIVVQ
jgi:hypothetical protein